MDILTLFGLFAVTAMLVTYALEQRSPWFILAFAVSCALGSGSSKASGRSSRFAAGNTPKMFHVKHF